MNTTLANRLWPQSETSTLHKALLVVAGSLALAISAKVQVPFWPVPMTMQTLVVLLIGASFGARLGGITLAAYLAQGAAGLPVFASGAGLAYMAGPTGGYLAGFLLAAIVVGALADRGFGRNVWTTLVAMVAGLSVIYALGVGWLAGFAGLEKAITLGVLPFLPAEAVKLALAALLLPSAWKLARR
jgi:biotin transport system substrate-specific component